MYHSIAFCGLWSSFGPSFVNRTGGVVVKLVRVIEELVPDIVGAVAVYNEGRDVDAETVQERTDDCVEFLLKAITDEDGRVRQAAGRGLQDAARTYDGLEDDAAVALLVHELDRLGDAVDDDVRAQVTRARRDIAHFEQFGTARVVKAFQRDLSER